MKHHIEYDKNDPWHVTVVVSARIPLPEGTNPTSRIIPALKAIAPLLTELAEESIYGRQDHLSLRPGSRGPGEP